MELLQAPRSLKTSQCQYQGNQPAYSYTMVVQAMHILVGFHNTSRGTEYSIFHHTALPAVIHEALNIISPLLLSPPSLKRHWIFYISQLLLSPPSCKCKFRFGARHPIIAPPGFNPKLYKILRRIKTKYFGPMDNPPKERSCLRPKGQISTGPAVTYCLNVRTRHKSSLWGVLKVGYLFAACHCLYRVKVT